MKTTTKLWATGICSGAAAMTTFTATVSYVLGAKPPSAPLYDLIAAGTVILGLVSAATCCSAVIVRALQDDQHAAAELRAASRLVEDGKSHTNLRLLR